jgi:hypothetical protein
VRPEGLEFKIIPNKIYKFGVQINSQIVITGSVTCELSAAMKNCC